MSEDQQHHDVATAAPSERQCGRCRKHFPVAPDANPATIAEWWACDPCRAALHLHNRPA